MRMASPEKKLGKGMADKKNCRYSTVNEYREGSALVQETERISGLCDVSEGSSERCRKEKLSMSHDHPESPQHLIIEMSIASAEVGIDFDWLI